MPTWSSRKPISLEPSSYDLKLMMNPKSRGDDGKGKEAVILAPEEKGKKQVESEETGRERLKRHREAMMGEVKIPENWGQEKLLKTDYTNFDALFAPHRLIVTARDALIADVRKAARSQR
ncbi:hypothetical protein SESBI_23439 [Sesbania bispinosa]|nr:hypothetical protein SESBI_23439 [Sesbania bispinosa]